MSFERRTEIRQLKQKERTILQPLRGRPPQHQPRGFAFRRWIESRGTGSRDSTAPSSFDARDSATRLTHLSHSSVVESSDTHAGIGGKASQVDLQLDKVTCLSTSTQSVNELPTDEVESVADSSVHSAPIGVSSAAGWTTASRQEGSEKKKKEHAILRKLKRIERRVRRVKRSRQELQQEVTECLQTLHLLRASRALASNIQAEAEATSALRAYVLFWLFPTAT